ncbi:uncharacterized protein LOC141823666 [Curcuma longa]|uniref:uncharacterized protein LOC141823666 n=1 Tax=Curcuma longa TaxID=136217 RepID=UPI003D9E9396
MPYALLLERLVPGRAPRLASGTPFKTLHVQNLRQKLRSRSLRPAALLPPPTGARSLLLLLDKNPRCSKPPPLLPPPTGTRSLLLLVGPLLLLAKNPRCSKPPPPSLLPPPTGERSPSSSSFSTRAEAPASSSSSSDRRTKSLFLFLLHPRCSSSLLPEACRRLISSLVLLLLLVVVVLVGAFALRNKDELRMKIMQVEEGGFEKGRMEIEVNDYPGSGPNGRHDPKNPGKP